MKKVESLSIFSPEWMAYREPVLKLINILAENKLTLSVIDGCGGHLLNQLTIPGATKAFRMGVVANTNEAKRRLGVPAAVISSYGEFSPQVASYLAELALTLHHDDVGLAVTGEFVSFIIRGGKPVTTHIAFDHYEHNDRGTRQFARSQAAIAFAHGCLRGKKLNHQDRTPLSPMFLPNLQLQKNISHTVQTLTHQLKYFDYKIATMESCTGGALACALESESPQLLDSAWVTYDEDAKISLGVPIGALAYGMVYSEQVALAMAHAIKERTGAAIALASTGAMDTPDTRPFHGDTKPGTVYSAIIVEGMEPMIKKLRVPVDAREKMKLWVVNEMLSDLSLSLNKVQSSFMISSSVLSIKL